MRVPRLWLVLAVACGVSGCARLFGARTLSAVAPGGVSFHEVAVGDERRDYLLHTPARAVKPMPVIFVLHGTSANANVVMEESAMNAVGDSTGALVVYPNGTGGIPYVRLFWNTEHCCTADPRDGPDEAGMVRAVVDSLAAHFPVDRSRIGLIGFSDAGTLAYLLACSDWRTLTAIGVLSGAAPSERCVPPAGISTMVFHGTADRNMRYGETPALVTDWARRQRCGPATTDTIPDVIRMRWTHCADGAVVELYSILGGRHAWPGGGRSTFIAPRPTASVHTSRLFADFVLDHPRAPR